MATGTKQGLNWSVTNSVFEIFGERGYVEGKDWTVWFSLVEGSTPFPAQVDSAPIRGDILNIIQTDTDDGNADKIDYVGLAPFAGLCLALEGVITAEHLENSEETFDRITCHNVSLGGAMRKVVILRDAAYTMATYTQDDEVV